MWRGDTPGDQLPAPHIFLVPEKVEMKTRDMSPPSHLRFLYLQLSTIYSAYLLYLPDLLEDTDPPIGTLSLRVQISDISQLL